MYVVRTDFTRQAQRAPVAKQAAASLILQSLASPGHMVRFDSFASASTARSRGGEVYQLLVETRGPWLAAPSHAVYALWEVTHPQHEAAFIESRRQLFQIRQRVLPTFAYDWLLKRIDAPGQYMVLGLYGDAEGAMQLCREHPEIKQFLQAHPASAYSALDLTGLCCLRVV
jgi:hypothetical protein